MAVHMRNGIQYGGIPNGTVKGVTPSTVPTTVKQLNQIGTVGNIAPVTIPSAVKFSNGNTLETAIGSVATIETSPAVATHAIGDYVFYNGQMYKVIAAIAVGETLTVDTNIEATSVGEELTALNTGLMTFTGVSAVSNRVTGLSGGYAYLNNHTVFVQISGTINININTAYEFAALTRLPLPWLDAPMSLSVLGVGSLNGFSANARVGGDGAVTFSLSKSSDTVYGKTFCLGGIYYVE